MSYLISLDATETEQDGHSVIITRDRSFIVYCLVNGCRILDIQIVNDRLEVKLVGGTLEELKKSYSEVMNHIDLLQFGNYFYDLFNAILTMKSRNYHTKEQKEYCVNTFMHIHFTCAEKKGVVS